MNGTLAPSSSRLTAAATCCGWAPSSVAMVFRILFVLMLGLSVCACREGLASLGVMDWASYRQRDSGLAAGAWLRAPSSGLAHLHRHLKYKECNRYHSIRKDPAELVVDRVAGGN